MELYVVMIDFIVEDDAYTYVGGIYTTKEKAIEEANKWGNNLTTFNLTVKNDYEDDVTRFLIEYRGMLDDEEIVVAINKHITDEEIPDTF